MASRHGLPDFSHSMTDLMASVAVTFLLIAAIFILRASDANRENQQRLQKVEDIRKQSLDALDEFVRNLATQPELRDAVHNDKADRFLVTVEFPAHALYFRTGSYELVEDAKEQLIAPLEHVVRLVCGIDETLTNSIMLEGHTDREGGYEMNVRLSAQRAQTVYFEVRNRLDDMARRCIDARFAVSGRGPVQPRDPLQRWDDERRPIKSDADRRVVLKVRFVSGGEKLAMKE